MFHDLVSILIPVHFPHRIGVGEIRDTLEETLRHQDAYCRPENTLLVVDRDSQADQVLSAAKDTGSPFHGLPLLRIDQNQGKAGAVGQGLNALLQKNRTPFLVTRDCDGDHMIDDLPTIVRMAQEMSLEGEGPCSVFGARPSLMKPMGWLRQEWENLTNAVVVDCAAYLAARAQTVLDRRFWNGYPLDLQAGYRLYDRRAAQLAARVLVELPDDPHVYIYACEPLPFLELCLAGGRVGQVRCSTRVDQPFSNYAGFSLAEHYGGFLKYVGKRYQIGGSLLRRILDNHLLESPLYLSEHRAEVLRFRSMLDSRAPLPNGPRFL